MIMDSVNLNQNSADLYDVIRNKYNKITMTDANGEDTIDETQAVQFDINDDGKVTLKDIVAITNKYLLGDIFTTIKI